MTPNEATLTGIIMGLLYGITLWASTDALAQASFILYGNPYYIPILSTLSITGIAFVLLFTYQYWEPFFEEAIFRDDEDR